ncbi:MAG: GvpL/GvpF family gas vesicle protein [Gemmatimonadaceae bacterium]
MRGGWRARRRAAAVPDSLGTAGIHPNRFGSFVIRSFSGRQAAVGNEGVLLYGVVAHEAGTLPRALGIDVVSLRELIALVRRVPYTRIDASSVAIVDYRSSVESAFRERAIVPAPFGTVFRSRDALIRWMELHYIALMDGLDFVQDKSAARVRVAARAEVLGADFETAVFDSLRFLKRHAVACVSMPYELERGHRAADASFLVQRDKWTEFAEAVRVEQERFPSMAIEQTGPWPAYDFVRLQFGG